MRSLLLRAGLRVADRVVRSLPSRAAYALASLGGRSWHRLAPERRRLVAENLGRVAVATGRPASGGSFNRLVERAFVEHARYWVELLRAPHYPADQLDEIVAVEPDAWARAEPLLRGGAVVAVPHLGNFEPFGHFLVLRGLRAVAPVEEVEPRELYEFLLERRTGGQGTDLVPLGKALRPMLTMLRAGGIAALVADRDLDGEGVPVTMFGHGTTLPAGPATLALRTGKPLLVARVLRIGPDRFRGEAWEVQAERTGDAMIDAVALTEAMGRRFEEVIGANPEQWFAAFQPFWTDQRR